MKKKIIYYKLKKKLKLDDGTIIDSNTPLRLNFQEGPFLNVESHESNNVKRMFWVTEDQVLKTKTRTEVWNKQTLENHEMDLKENWLDNSDDKVKIKK